MPCRYHPRAREPGVEEPTMSSSTPLVNTVLYLRWLLAVLCVLGSFVADTAVGQTLWEENGHYYLIVEQETTWQQARLLAESMVFMGVQGHLATITSEAENTFVTTQLGDTAGAWLGGKQPPGSSEPEGGWGWITGEPWVYTNWDEGEPNNTYFGGWGKDATGQSEERLQYHHNGTHWNDLPADPEVITPRFIVEWDVPTEACVPPPAGLVSWWPGDGNANDIQNGNDGTLQNGATFAQGLVEQAFSLDGIDDVVNVGNALNLHVSAGNFTVDAWVKFDVEGVFPDIDDMSIADKMSAEGINQNGWRLMRQRDNGHFWFCFGGGTINGCDFNEDRTGTTATSVRSTTVAQKNVWYHVVGVLSPDQIAIYVNGIREGEKARPLFTDTNAADLLIGANAAEGAHVDGLVDEVEIYNRALSAEEIQAIFNAGSAGKCKETEVQEVTIDIQPGSAPNHINPKSNGTIQVAILTTNTFDATTVDPLTVRFGPEGAEVHGKGHIRDVNHDGEPDLVLHFKTRATGIQCGDTSAALTGETFDGDPIQGSDAIQTVGCKH
jgi:hypothetical protein